jgi:di/tricarboxylate transporter
LNVTTPQLLSFGVLAAMMLLFVWGRIRHDLVAILALLVAIALGLVPPDAAFSGFADDIVIIIASALVVSAAVARSGIIELALNKVARWITGLGGQLFLLVGSVTFLSAFVKNVGALAMLMPSAFQVAKRSQSSPSCILMPMAFGSLLGGLITLVGTSPNIIVSRVRQEMTGEPFSMFDFAPVGLGLAIAGLVFLRFGYRLLPAARRAAPTAGEAIDITSYSTEARVPPNAPAEGLSAREFYELTEGEVYVEGTERGEMHHTRLPSEFRIESGDILILRGDPEALERAIATGGLQLTGQHREAIASTGASEIGVLEAVIGQDSVLSGAAAGRIALHERHGVNLIAVSRQGVRISNRLRDVVLASGDVIVLQGPLASLPDRLRELGCMPLAERSVALGERQRSALPILILAVAMVLTALGLVPVALAFLGAACAIVLTGGLPGREVYRSIDWPIIIMIGALIPVSETVRSTGGTELLAGWLAGLAFGLPPWGALALIMAAAMAVTPFLNNAATVLVMAPVASMFATQLGFRPDAFLMAVAVGAGSDFLTPVGHQCNTLVWGAGGYRFGDYARLGAPLSVLVLAVGVPLILFVWPL